MAHLLWTLTAPDLFDIDTIKGSCPSQEVKPEQMLIFIVYVILLLIIVELFLTHIRFGERSFLMVDGGSVYVVDVPSIMDELQSAGIELDRQEITGRCEKMVELGELFEADQDTINSLTQCPCCCKPKQRRQHVQRKRTLRYLLRERSLLEAKQSTDNLTMSTCTSVKYDNLLTTTSKSSKHQGRAKTFMRKSKRPGRI